MAAVTNDVRLNVFWKISPPIPDKIMRGEREGGRGMKKERNRMDLIEEEEGEWGDGDIN